MVLLPNASRLKATCCFPSGRDRSGARGVQPQNKMSHRQLKRNKETKTNLAKAFQQFLFLAIFYPNARVAYGKWIMHTLLPMSVDKEFASNQLSNQNWCCPVASSASTKIAHNAHRRAIKRPDRLILFDSFS